jgi:hypothetical protein
MKQLANHFRPDPKIIKKRIEDLIQREYLERDGKLFFYFRKSSKYISLCCIIFNYDKYFLF